MDNDRLALWASVERRSRACLERSVRLGLAGGRCDDVLVWSPKLVATGGKKRPPLVSALLLVFVGVAGVGFAGQVIVWSIKERMRLRTTEWIDVAGAVREFHYRPTKSDERWIFRVSAYPRSLAFFATFDPEAYAKPVNVRARIPRRSQPFKIFGAPQRYQRTYGVWIDGQEVVSHDDAIAAAFSTSRQFTVMGILFGMLCGASLYIGMTLLRQRWRWSAAR